MTTNPGGALRVGLIGYGLAGSVFHAPLIASIDDFALDTIVTANPERQASALGAYPGVHVAASVEELWERSSKLSLVVVASPNRTHVPFATAALRAGLSVVVDKPVTATAPEVASLAALAEASGLMLSVFQNRRWDNDFLTLRAVVDGGELGDVWRYESRYERWRPEPKGGWRESGDPVEVGGLLYDLGSHLVDQALVLFGPVSSVYAEVLLRRPKAEVNDDSFLALEHASGVRSHLWMNVIAAQLGPRFRVLGSRSSFVKYGLDPQEDALKEGGRPGPGWGTEEERWWGKLGAGEGARPVPTLPGDYPAYYKGIAHALRHSAPPPVTAREAQDTIAVLEAAQVSAREGGPVNLGAPV